MCLRGSLSGDVCGERSTVLAWLFCHSAARQPRGFWKHRSGGLRVCLVSRPSAMWHLQAPGSAFAVRRLLRRPLCLPTHLHRGQERPWRAASVIKCYSLPMWDPEVDFSTSTSAWRRQEEPGRVLAPRAWLLGTWRAPHCTEEELSHQRGASDSAEELP